MDIQSSLLLITAGMNVGFGLFILSRNPRAPVNISFFATLLTATTWSFGVAMFRLSDEVNLRFWLNFHYTAAALIVIAFYYFSHYFPVQYRPLARVTHAINIMLLIAALYIGYFGGVVKEIFFDVAGNHEVTINGLNYTLYSLFIIGYFLASFVNFRRKLLQSAGIHRRSLVIVLIATLLAAVLGVYFNLILPIFTYRYIWIGPLFTVLMVMIIVRYVFASRTD